MYKRQGYNPTFTALDKPSLEVNIFDFNQDIYGEKIVVEFYLFIRKEKSFHNKDELIQQLNLDQAYIQKYFQTYHV